MSSYFSIYNTKTHLESSADLIDISSPLIPNSQINSESTKTNEEVSSCNPSPLYFGDYESVINSSNDSFHQILPRDSRGIPESEIIIISSDVSHTTNKDSSLFITETDCTSSPIPLPLPYDICIVANTNVSSNPTMNSIVKECSVNIVPLSLYFLRQKKNFCLLILIFR